MAGDMTSQTVMESLRKGQTWPLYFLYGDESFLIDDFLAALQAQIVGEGMKDFNYNSYYGDDADPAAVRDAIETLPVMAPVRLVVLKEAQDLKEKFWEALAPVLENPVDSCIFVCVASKIDKRKKFIKRFQEKGSVVEFKRPYDNQIPDWIIAIAKRHSLQIKRDVAEVLQQLVGSNLTDLNAEMLKLSQYVGDRQTPSVDDVMSIVSRVRVDSVFDLTEAIGNGDRALALDYLVNLLDHGQSEVGVLALVTRHLRILKLVREGVKEGLGGAKLAARAGVSPYFLKGYQEQSRKWNENKIEHAFEALLDTDRALKSSPVSGHIWLENFIIRTCSGSPLGAR